MAVDENSDLQSDVSDESSWDDVEGSGEEENEAAIISLFDDRVFSDAVSMVSYCKERYGFDFLATRDRLALDFYGTIKLINYSRLIASLIISIPSLIPLQYDQASMRAELSQARSLLSRSRMTVTSDPCWNGIGGGR